MAQKKFSSSDAFANNKEAYLYGNKPNEMFLCYDNRENDKGWKEVVSLERNMKKDTQQ